MSNLLKNLRINPRYDLQAPYVEIFYEQTDTINGQGVLGVFTDHYPDPLPTAAQSQFNSLQFTVDLQGTNATNTTAKLVCDFLDIQNPAWWLRKHPQYTPCNPANPVDVQSNPIASFTILDVNGVSTVTRAPIDSPRPDQGYVNELRTGQLCDWMNFGSQRLTVSCKATIVYRNGKETKTVPLSFQCLSTNATTGTYNHGNTTAFGENVPQNLARDIYTAISVLQYEGSVTLQEEDCSGSLSVGQLFNLVNGANAAWSTMAAQVQRIEENIDTGETTIEFGPPKHLSAGELVDILRVNRHRLMLGSPNMQQSGQTSGTQNQVDLGQSTPEKNSATAEGNANPHVVSNFVEGSGPGVQHSASVEDVTSTWKAYPGGQFAAAGGAVGSGPGSLGGSVTISLKDCQGQNLAIRPTPVCINGVEGIIYMLRSALPGET